VFFFLQPFCTASLCLFVIFYKGGCCPGWDYFLTKEKKRRRDTKRRRNLQLLSLFKVDARRLTEQERERKEKEKREKRKKKTRVREADGEYSGEQGRKQSQERTSILKIINSEHYWRSFYAFVYQEGSISSSSLSSIIFLLNFFWTSSRYFSSSSLATKAMARPLVPKRPARPIRWRYSSLLS